MANNTKWFWMWYSDVKYNNTSYVPSKVYDSNILTSAWKYLSTATLGDNSSNKSQESYAYIRIGYYWDSVDKVNRTAKLHIQMELVEFQNYVCINNQSLLQLGMNIVGHTTMNKTKIKGIVEYKPYLMNVRGYTYANRGNSFTDNYVVYTPNSSGYPYGYIGGNTGTFNNNYGGKSRYIANHIIILDRQEATIPYNASGVASATINYDILFGYQIVNNGKKFNASGKGSFVVTDAPKIPTLLTGISIRATNSYNALRPKSISLTGLTNNATSYNLEVTETTSKSKTFGAKVNDYIPYTFEQSFSVSPSTNVSGTVSVTSNNPNVLTINTPTVNIANSKKFKCTCKNPGTAIITLSGNGKTAKQTFTVKTDNTFTWSSSSSKIVSVDNGKVTANAGYNGKVTITAKSKGNTSLTKSLTINSLLRPTSYTITPDRYIMYPGETIDFRIKVNPFSSNESTSTASAFRGVDWIIANNNASERVIYTKDVLKEGSSKAGDFNVQYKLTSDANTRDYIVCDVSASPNDSENWSYFTNLRTSMNIHISSPEIEFSKPSLDLSFGTTEKVKVITTPANGRYTLDYDKSFLEIVKDEDTLKIKALKTGNTTITATGNMTILPYMTQPTATLSVNVIDTMLTSLTSNVTNVTHNLDYAWIFVGDLFSYESKYVKYGSSIYEFDISKESITVRNNEIFYTDVFLKFKPLTNCSLKLTYKPKQSSDTLIIYSEDNSVARIDYDDGQDYKSLNLEGLNGTAEISFNCIKEGKTAIVVQSLSQPNIAVRVNVTVTADKSISWKYDLPVYSKYIPEKEIKQIGETEYNVENEVYVSHFSLKAGDYNADTSIYAYPTKAKSDIKDRLGVIIELVPNNIGLCIEEYNDKKVNSFNSICTEIDAFVLDKLLLSMALSPNENNMDRQVTRSLRKVNYNYYADGKLLANTNSAIKAKYSQNELTYTFPFSIPKEIKADTYKIEAVTNNKYNVVLSSYVIINITQPSLYVEGYEDTNIINIYLANINDNKEFSQKKLNVKVTPSNQKFEVKPAGSAERGYTSSRNNNVLTIKSTSIRNLHTETKSAKETTAIETVYVNGKPNRDILGYDFNITYAGNIQDGRTRPSVRVNVFNLQYFKEPIVENTNGYNSTSGLKELKYFGDKPKIILSLPSYNDFDVLDDIQFDFYGGPKYSFKNNPELFSISYNGDTKNHSLISSAIVDYTTSDNKNVCVFSPNKAVSDGNVTITYVSKYDTIPNSSTKIKIIKKNLPNLPNVGDPIKLSPMQDYLNAITDVLGVGRYDIFDDKDITLNFIGSNTKDKESSILAMPFLKLLLLLNKWLSVYKDYATYTNGNDIITPSNLTFEPVRNMFVKRSSRDKWVKTKYENELFYETYKQLTGKEFLDDSFPNDDYPVMVDDSNDFVGDESFGIQNKFKSTQYYNEYTISPLVEIIKALKQL